MRPDIPKHIADRDGGVLLKMAGCSAMNPERNIPRRLATRAVPHGVWKDSGNCPLVSYQDSVEEMRSEATKSFSQKKPSFKCEARTT